MIIFVNNSVISSQFSLVVILGCSFGVSRILNVINMSVKIILKGMRFEVLTVVVWKIHIVLMCDTVTLGE